MLLGKMKIHELAKEIDKTSKDIIAVAQELGLEVKSHMSSLEEKDIEQVKKRLLEEKIENKVKKETVKEVKESKKESSPVIEEVKVEEPKPIKKPVRKTTPEEIEDPFQKMARENNLFEGDF